LIAGLHGPHTKFIPDLHAPAIILQKTQPACRSPGRQEMPLLGAPDLPVVRSVCLRTRNFRPARDIPRSEGPDHDPKAGERRIPAVLAEAGFAHGEAAQPGDLLQPRRRAEARTGRPVLQAPRLARYAM